MDKKLSNFNVDRTIKLQEHKKQSVYAKSRQSDDAKPKD